MGRLPRSALVTFGSETGNAQDVAEELGRMVERLRFVVHIAALDMVTIQSLREHDVILVVISTTGQGDLPLNARVFWKSLLRKKLPPDLLRGVNFTSFGLGDSSYPKFNWAVRKLHKRLVQLGAEEIHPRSEADEQHPEGLDAFLIPWSTALRKLLLEKYPLPEGTSPIPDDVLLEPKWSLEAQEKDLDCSSLAGLPRSVPSCPGAASATLIENTRLTPVSHWQDVRKLTLTIPRAQYTSGDVLTIFPRNFEDDINQMIDLMSWNYVADTPLAFVANFSTLIQPENSDPPKPDFPTPLTLRTLLTNYLDITAIPRRSFFSLIAHFTSDPLQRDRLLEFTRPEYVDELYDYTTRPRRSILEVLQEFTSVKIPLKWVCNVFPPLRGRQFSIASGGALKRTSLTASSREEGTTRVELLVAIVKYRTIIKKTRQGVCTRYLASLALGTALPVLLQPGGLGITKADLRRPVILIGPGTGVAPIRSLIWERLEWAQEHHDFQHSPLSVPIGESILFFGCRSKDSDDFFANEWEDLKAKIPLQVFKAYSRDQRQKIYVQDLIRQQAPLVTRVLREQNGLVYICGSSGKMPQAVREALIHAFETDSVAGLPGLDRAAAEAYMAAIEKEGRYKQETW